MSRSKEEMEIARSSLERRRESQGCEDRLGEEEWMQLMSVLPMLLGLITDLRLEQAVTDLGFAESIGPIVNPILYKEYLSSRKGDDLKEVLNALARVKAVALDQMEVALNAEETTQT